MRLKTRLAPAAQPKKLSVINVHQRIPAYAEYLTAFHFLFSIFYLPEPRKLNPETLSQYMDNRRLH